MKEPGDDLATAGASGLGPAFLDALLADFAVHGAEAIRRCARTAPRRMSGFAPGSYPSN